MQFYHLLQENQLYPSKRLDCLVSPYLFYSDLKVSPSRNKQGWMCLELSEFYPDNISRQDNSSSVGSYALHTFDHVMNMLKLAMTCTHTSIIFGDFS